MAGGGMATQGQWRVALLGKTGAGKSTVAEKIRMDESSVSEEKSVRKLTVVDTPGWDKSSVEHTLNTTKQEIIQIVTQPGSHALLLVLPVTVYGQEPSEEEIESHCQHIELLSEAAWKYTIILFSCQGQVEQSVIDQHLKAAEKLLEKCDRRHIILQKNTPISNLYEKIEKLVVSNRRDCLTLLVYYGELTKMKRQLEDTQKKLKDHEAGPKKKRNSLVEPPAIGEGKLTLLGSPPLMIFMMAFAGAVIGIVIGATEGTPGSGLVRGFIIGVVLAVVMLVAMNFVKDRSSSTGVEKKPDTGVDPTEKSKEQ